MWTRSELKEAAKAILQLKYWPCVIMSFIFVLVAGRGGGGYSGYNAGRSYGELQNAGVSPEELQVFMVIMAFVVFICIVASIIGLLVSTFVFMPMQVGCYKFFVECRDGSPVIEDVIYFFSHSYLNVVKIMFLRWLKTFLWTMLFIIPGIIKAYEYAMIPYIVAEEPDISSAEAFARSRAMMDGNKWNTFVLQFSFIGWVLLSLFTLCLLSIFYVNPYYNLTMAELYHTLKAEKSPAAYDDSYNTEPAYEPL